MKKIVFDIRKYGIVKLRKVASTTLHEVNSSESAIEAELVLYTDQSNNSFASISYPQPNGILTSFFGEAYVTDADTPLPDNVYGALCSTDQNLVIKWLEGGLIIPGNPVELRFTTTPDGGYKFTLDNIESGSKKTNHRSLRPAGRFRQDRTSQQVGRKAA
jgi:hypothetical protein